MEVINEFGDEAWVYDTYHHCPWLEVSDFAFTCGKLYGHYKAGHLLRSGGIEDQPFVYVEAMRIMDSEFAKMQMEKMEQDKEQAKQNLAKYHG